MESKRLKPEERWMIPTDWVTRKTIVMSWAIFLSLRASEVASAAAVTLAILAVACRLTDLVITAGALDPVNVAFSKVTTALIVVYVSLRLIAKGIDELWRVAIARKVLRIAPVEFEPIPFNADALKGRPTAEEITASMGIPPHLLDQQARHDTARQIMRDSGRAVAEPDKEVPLIRTGRRRRSDGEE